MRKISLFFSVIFLFLCLSLSAQNGKFGAGIIIGEPTGLAAEYGLDNSTALRFAAAYSFLPKEKKISLHVDYIKRITQFEDTILEFPLYYGAGLRWRFREGAYGSFGVRGIGGLIWSMEKLPVIFFGELAPVFELFPKTDLTLDGAIGLIYYFN